MVPKDNQLVILGETNFRSNRWRFGIKNDDRRRHMYVVGSTGMGKTEFLKNMAIQDIEAGRGLAYIDPHGDAADYFLDYIPAERVKDVIYLDPGDIMHPIAFNVMEKVDFEYRHLVASGLLGVFKKIFGVEAWSGRMEYILNNTILALLEYPGSTLLGINKMLSNKEYRKKVVDNVKDPLVRSFWVDEFAKYTERFAAEATPAIQNKIGQFISNNLIRNIIGQTNSTIDIRKIMDEGKILIVNLSRGKIGEDASRLLGALLITKIQLAAMSRVDIPESDRRDFYLYVDEFQHFATESFANILSEARKFHLSLVVAHQYIKQMEEPVRDAVFGNVGTIISFRVGAEDGEFLEKWFQPDFMMGDIVNLGKYNIYLKLMIDGVSSKGFSAQTIPPFPKLEKSNRDAVLEYSRKTYATPRESVEKTIAEWAGPDLTIAKSPDRGPDDSRGQSYQQRPSQPQRDYYRDAPPRPRQSYQAQDRPSGGQGGYGGGYERREPMQQTYERSPRNEYREPQRNDNHPSATQPAEGPRTIGLEPRKISINVQPQSMPEPAKPVPQPAQPQPMPTPKPPQPQVRAEQIIKPVQPIQPAPRLVQPEPHLKVEPVEPRPNFASLDQAFKQGPVNFKGRRMEERKEKPKVEVNTDELRKALEEAMGKKD